MRVFDIFGHETSFCMRERAMNDIKTVIDFEKSYYDMFRAARQDAVETQSGFDARAGKTVFIEKQ